jgi:hypothetical protein
MILPEFMGLVNVFLEIVIARERLPAGRKRQKQSKRERLFFQQHF